MPLRKFCRKVQAALPLSPDARALMASGEKIKQSLIFNVPRTLNIQTGEVTPATPTDLGKSIGTALKEALESGEVKRVKIF